MATDFQKVLLGGYGTHSKDAVITTKQYGGEPLWGQLWSTSLGSCCGVSLFLHYSLHMYIIFMIVNVFVGDHKGQKFLVNLYGILILFSAMVFLVIGRIISTKLMGGQVDRIVISAFTSFTSTNCDSTPKTRICINLGGGVFLGAYSAAWFLLWSLTSKECHDSFILFNEDWGNCFWSNLGLQATTTSCLLLVLNLSLPCYPLHGGYVFISVLHGCCGFGYNRLARICIGTSTVYFVILSLAFLKFNSVLSLLVCLLLAYETWVMYKHLKQKMILQHPLFKGLEFTEPVAEIGQYQEVPLTEDDNVDVESKLYSFFGIGKSNTKKLPEMDEHGIPEDPELGQNCWSEDTAELEAQISALEKENAKLIERMKSGDQIEDDLLYSNQSKINQLQLKLKGFSTSSVLGTAYDSGSEKIERLSTAVGEIEEHSI